MRTQNKEYWNQVIKNLDKQIVNEDNLETYRFFLKVYDSEEDMVTSTELSVLDKFQALVAVYCSINMVALEEEEYEVCLKIRAAFESQFNFLSNLIENDEESEMVLELTQEYFTTTLQLQAENR